MLRKPSRLISVIAIVALILGVTTAPVSAQRRSLQFLSDAETEHIIRGMMQPIFEVAGIDPKAVDIVMVNDRTLNAFVAGGQNIFVNTGLLLEVASAEELIGVLAHETGHIAGGHLVRGYEEMDNAFLTSLIGLGLAVAAGAATGNANVGLAGALLSQHMTERSVLGFTRTQESSADHAGLSYLDKAGISARGLLAFLEKLDAQNPLLTKDPEVGYATTHPLNRERLDAIRDFIAHSRNSDKTLPPQVEDGLKRIQAKLFAYLDPNAALRKYRVEDPSIVARYGRAYAYFRQGDGRNALPLVDGLIASEPKNAFFYELKGDLMLQTARPADAVPSYRKAVELAPTATPIRVSLAHALLEQNNPKLADEALRALEAATRAKDASAFTWRLTARAYSLKGNEPMAIVASAEEAVLQGDIPKARAMAERAEKLLPAGSPGWLRAQDIRGQTEKRK